jgi:hypothetical protein
LGSGCQPSVFIALAFAGQIPQVSRWGRVKLVFAPEAEKPAAPASDLLESSLALVLLRQEAFEGMALGLAARLTVVLKGLAELAPPMVLWFVALV